MSVANFGVSRFEESTVYADVNFTGTLNVTNINAGNEPLVLSSNSLIKFSGTLASQDFLLNTAGVVVLNIANIGIDQVYVVDDVINITLPEIIGGGAGVPNGTRMRFVTTANGTVTFKTSAASAVSIVYYVTKLDGGGVLDNKFAAVANNVNTAPYLANSVISVYSANSVWNVQGSTYTPI